MNIKPFIARAVATGLLLAQSHAMAGMNDETYSISRSIREMEKTHIPLIDPLCRPYFGSILFAVGCTVVGTSVGGLLHFDPRIQMPLLVWLGGLLENIVTH